MTATSYSPLPPRVGSAALLPTGMTHSGGDSDTDPSRTTSTIASALLSSSVSVRRTMSRPIRAPATYAPSGVIEPPDAFSASSKV